MVSAADILNANILIVDDQESNVILLEQLLSEAGYARVTSTKSNGLLMKSLAPACNARSLWPGCAVSTITGR